MSYPVLPTLFPEYIPVYSKPNNKLPDKRCFHLEMYFPSTALYEMFDIYHTYTNLFIRMTVKFGNGPCFIVKGWVLIWILHK